MKKLKSSLGAKIAALILLAVMLVVAAASIVGMVILIGNESYLDNGESIRISLLSSAVREAENDLKYLINALPVEANEPGRESVITYYAEKYSVENSNLCIRIRDEDGKILFRNREYENYIPATAQTREYYVMTGETRSKFSKTFNSVEELYDYEETVQAYVDSFNYEENPQTGIITAYFTVIHTEQTPVTIQIAVAQELTAEDACSRAMAYADRLIRLRDFLLPIAIAALCVALALFVFLLCAAGHKAGVEGIHLNWVDKIPFDLYLAVLVFLCAGSFALTESWGYSVWEYVLRIAIGFAWLLPAFSPILSFAARAKAGKWWRNTLIFYVLRLLWRALRWLCRGIRYLCVRLPLVWRTALACVGVSVLELLFLFGFSREMAAWLFVLEKLMLVPLVIFAAINLRQLQKGGEAIAEGNMDYRVRTRPMLPSFRRHAENLNSIGTGMQKAVEVQMRSERMKAELITNVSHDIKTPLTSIVNYVDLLKTAGLNSKQAPEYLAVLDRQSARLKKLTEDLVEASKASTGNIAVHAERTDVNVLLSQAVGEYEERLRAKGLEPVLALNAAEPYVYADGRLLWRVIDNLLGNACKYSLEHTRVYLQTEEQNGRLFLLFKNISREALNVPASELMERFVRGDASRNTEGSGLGLSIARSLTELQGGAFALAIDGDLFKAEVSFPLMKE